MFDDQDDLDGNGIPDAIQRDPVVVPPESVAVGVFDPEPGLPGITSPMDATAEAGPGSAAADPQAMADQQHEAQVFGMLSSSVNETLKAIGEGLSTAARND
jgi:hypothetical protein